MAATDRRGGTNTLINNFVKNDTGYTRGRLGWQRHRRTCGWEKSVAARVTAAAKQVDKREPTEVSRVSSVRGKSGG